MHSDPAGLVHRGLRQGAGGAAGAAMVPQARRAIGLVAGQPPAKDVPAFPVIPASQGHPVSP